MFFFFDQLNSGVNANFKCSELLYLWIDKTKYKCFENAEFNFSSQFEFHFDGSTIIGKKTGYPNVFENGTICNISAIVGANGVGKSTLLDFVANLSGESRKTFSFERGNGYYIAIYRFDDQIVVKNYTEIKEIACKGNINYIAPIATSRLDEYTNEIFGNTTTVYLSLEDRFTSSFSRKENKSFVPLTPRQINNKSTIFEKNKTPEELFKTLTHNSFSLENLVMSDYLGKNDDIIDYPITASLSFYTTWSLIRKERKNNMIDNILDRGVQNIKIKDTVREYGPSFVLMLNLLNEAKLLNIEQRSGYLLENIMNSYKLSFDKSVDTLTEYLESSYLSYNIKSYFKIAIDEIKVFHKLEKYCVYSGDLTNRVESDTYTCLVEVSRLKSLIEKILSKKYSFIYKYLDIRFEKSEGELARIRHESYLYYLANRTRFFNDANLDIKNNLIILLDEVDVHLHPEWQRTLIKRLISSTERLFVNKNVQLILTSHSPIVLSDMPGKNVVYISYDKNHNRIIEKRDINTFGANIHELYKDSFFFENKLAIGEYARGYIDTLYYRIHNREIEKECAEQAIDIIGERVLKNRLLEAIKQTYSGHETINKTEVDASVIKEIKKQIRQLEQLVNYLENKK